MVLVLISAVHRDFLIFAESSLQKCSKSVQLHHLLSSGHLTIFHLDSVLGSGLAWPFQNFNLLLIKPFFFLIWMLSVFGTLNVKMLSSINFTVFAKTQWCLKLLRIPSTLTKALAQPEENAPKAWCCHHHASPWVCIALVVIKSFGILPLVSSDQKHFSTSFWETW